LSDQAEEFAKQLLEKTEGGKLQWTPFRETGGENYRANLEAGHSFSIKRVTDGDNKVLALWLEGPDGPVLSGTADNLPTTIRAARLGVDFGTAAEKSTQGKGAALGSPLWDQTAGILDFPTVSRFRLFSDLFYAAQRNAVGKDPSIERVHQRLERLG
jgi:hypothetical protein